MIGTRFTNSTDEELYQQIKARLLKEIPAQLRVLIERPEIQVAVKRHVIDVEGDSLRGRMALLIKEGFFDTGVKAAAITKELKRRTSKLYIKGPLYNELNELIQLGFLTVETPADKSGKIYQAVEAMKENVREKE